ncbi:26S proteasome non-ATPase regulatory subunit 9 [Aricia agestis]|uniref:26S proteasome non-ATPase regulatory subunit 9 n=1 Tax=Aricia agestis TaxID=91739 RepID=UPI001C20B4F2|nr:26S proteasome non-ATPase regulatory subunit 9 [Aricia agestis]
MVGYNMDGAARDRVMKLIQDKDRIESEIREQNLVLEANHVGMQDSLTDSEGFPRNDIDVYKVRHARHRIICLQNDHKNIMKQIEQGLGDVHAGFLGSTTSNGASTSQLTYTNGHSRDITISNGSDAHEHTFAVVGFVQEGSPADLSGLCENDNIIQFGSVTANNFSDITQVHNVVMHSVGQPIQVKVRRGTHILCMTVTPRPWGQPGLLGCQINRLAFT